MIDEISDDNEPCGECDTAITLAVEIGEFEENIESVNTALGVGAGADGEM